MTRTSALTRAGSTRRWRRLRAVVLERDGYRCRCDHDGQLCGAYADQAGHVVSRHDGGTDALDNLRAECADCNLSRGAGAICRRQLANQAGRHDRIGGTPPPPATSSAGRRWEWD